jgi:hypothetical protein
MAPSVLELVEESGSSLLSHVACRSGFPHVAMAAVVMLLRLASERGSWSRLLSHGGLPSTSQRGDDFDSPDVHLQSELPGIIGPANQPPAGTPTEGKKAHSHSDLRLPRQFPCTSTRGCFEFNAGTARGQRPKVGLPAKVSLGWGAHPRPRRHIRRNPPQACS